MANKITKKIDGRVYYYVSSHSGRKIADSVADGLRRRGHLARIIDNGVHKNMLRYSIFHVANPNDIKR